MPDRAAAAASAAAYTASGGTVLFGVITPSELAALIGAAAALGTFLVNWYYRHKAHDLAERQQKVLPDD